MMDSSTYYVFIIFLTQVISYSGEPAGFVLSLRPVLFTKDNKPVYCRMQSVTYPVEHSHLYDPTVLLQV